MPRRKQSEPHRSDEIQQNRVSLDNEYLMGASTSNLFAETSNVLEVVNRNDDSQLSEDSEIVTEDGQPDGVPVITLEDETDLVLNSTTEDSGSSMKSKKRQSSKYGYSKGKRKKNAFVTDPCLQHYLDHCDFYLTIVNTMSYEEMDHPSFPAYSLGSITVKSETILDKSQLKHSPFVYLYISPVPKKCILYLEDLNGVIYWQVQCCAPYSALDSIKNKRMFSLFLVESGCDSNYEYNINIFIEPSGFHTPQHQSDTNQNLNMLSAVEYFLKIPVPECPPSPSKPKWPHKTTQELYNSVRELRLKNQGGMHIEPLFTDNLLPCLRPYQQDAVQWMITRERGSTVVDKLHPLYMELQLPSGQLIYFNMYSGILCLEKPVAVVPPLGGILADEMGLGKTVEILACILTHPRTLQTDIDVQSKREDVPCAQKESAEIHNSDSSNSDNCESGDFEVNGSSESKDNSVCKSSDNYVHEGTSETNDINNCIGSRTNSGLQNNADSFNCDSSLAVASTTLNISLVNTEDIPTSETMNAIEEVVVDKVKGHTNADSAEEEDVESSDADTEIVDGSETDTSDYEPEKDFKTHVKTVRTRNSKIGKKEDEEDGEDKDKIEIDLTDELFECLCGQDHWEWEWVQCTYCGSWQHKFCMDFGFDMDESEYLCPHCWVSDETPLAKSRATLVVTPSSIRCQWEEEIKRHLKPGSLKWTFYPGVGQLTQFMQPPRLADHDLVLITYETLRKEIDYVDLPHSNSDSGRRLRNPKRFMAIPTPLLAVEWWRVCLDEAQMVEGVTTKTAEMALRLSAVNRWCVTGTPIQKSIDDMYGLLLFLGEDPYWQKAWWKRLLYDPYRSGSPEPLLNVLSKCFWRNTKNDVFHQIGLPPQSEVTYRLVFSPVEEHFYKLQYQECSADALRKIAKIHNLDIKLKELDKQTMAHVMGPLARLRQACCHPQAVRGHFLPIQKSTITMEDLLTTLIKKTKLECEDFHRQFICALNGLAGIHIIHEEIPEAVEKYRDVLRAVKEQKDILKTDKIQQYHTLHNLSLLLEGVILPFEERQPDATATVINNNIQEEHRTSQEEGSNVTTVRLPPNVGRTLEDDTLREDSERLRSTYLEKCQAQVSAAQAQLLKVVQSIDEIKAQFYDEGEDWWAVGCKIVMRSRTDEALVFKVKDALSNTKKLKDSLSNRFNTLNGLMLMFTTLLEALKESHNALTSAIMSLSSTPSQDDVNAAITCHLRPLVTTTDRCVYCRCHELFNHYEGLLFCFETGFEKDPLTNEEALWGQTRKGTWADSELECTLKTVLAYFRASRVNPSVIENGNLHMKLFEARKKEFRCLRGVWMQIRDYASALDELEMAKIRFRLRLPDEPKPDIPLPYILEPEEVQAMKLKMMSDRAVAQNDLRKKLGQLFYLQNLQKADFGKKGGSNSEACPICQKMLGTQWSVMQCGHCFCVECIRILIVEYSVGFRNHSVRCAICRQVTAHAEITYVNTSPGEGTLDEEMAVKGSHSTKVEAVIRCLLTIKKDEPEAKSLVFSSWQLVLNVLEDALTQNDISCVTLQSHNLRKSLWQFKHNPDVHVLLLPVHSGANGLNLIEATHVLMVEPLLNPAAEVQALGRVHRIGQTKPTTVHRFIVSSTIEERIYEACAGHSDDDSMTLAELKKLFEVK